MTSLGFQGQIVVFLNCRLYGIHKYNVYKRHLITNTLFFIFYEKNVNSFSNTAFQKPQTLADSPVHITCYIQGIRVLAREDFPAQSEQQPLNHTSCLHLSCQWQIMCLSFSGSKPSTQQPAQSPGLCSFSFMTSGAH